MEAADRILCQKLDNLNLLPSAKKLYDLTDNDVIRIIHSILNIRENEKSDIQTPKSTLARFKLVTRLANQIDELGYYSVINYETFLTPDFSPQGSTRNVISWLLNRLQDDKKSNNLQKLFSLEQSKLYFGGNKKESEIDFSFLSYRAVDEPTVQLDKKPTLKRRKTATPKIKNLEKENYEDLILKIDQKIAKYKEKCEEIENNIKTYENYANLTDIKTEITSLESKIIEHNDKIKIEEFKLSQANQNISNLKLLTSEMSKNVQNLIKENKKMEKKRDLAQHELISTNEDVSDFDYFDEIDKIRKVTSLIQRQHDDVIIQQEALEKSRSHIQNLGTEVEKVFKQCQKILKSETAIETKHKREIEELILELHQAGSILSLKIQQRFELRNQIDRSSNPGLLRKQNLVKMIQNHNS